MILSIKNTPSEFGKAVSELWSMSTDGLGAKWDKLWGVADDNTEEGGFVEESSNSGPGHEGVKSTDPEYGVNIDGIGARHATSAGVGIPLNLKAIGTVGDALNGYNSFLEGLKTTIDVVETVGEIKSDLDKYGDLKTATSTFDTVRGDNGKIIHIWTKTEWGKNK